MLPLNKAVPLGLEQHISITHICHLLFSQEEGNKHANGQMAFNLTKNYLAHTTGGYPADMRAIADCNLCVLQLCTCAWCTHLPERFPWNSLVDLPIVSHNPMFCRWDAQTPPACIGDSFFPSSLYR